MLSFGNKTPVRGNYELFLAFNLFLEHSCERKIIKLYKIIMLILSTHADFTGISFIHNLIYTVLQIGYTYMYKFTSVSQQSHIWGRRLTWFKIYYRMSNCPVHLWISTPSRQCSFQCFISRISITDSCTWFLSKWKENKREGGR